MNILNHDSDYEKEKAKAHEYYLKIGQVWCPVLNDHVAFNNVGFRHLIRRGRRPRLNGDQKRRFSLLRFAREILENPLANIVYKKIEISQIEFWAVTAPHGKDTITVIVRRVGQGNKHFFSIYN